MKEEKITLEKFSDAIKFVDNDFLEVLVLLNNLGVITDEKIRRTFETKKEVEEFFQDFVSDYLNEKYSDLHDKISELRKKGKDLTDISLKLSRFKLKLKMFRANLNNHSFNKAVLILEDVKKKLGEFDSAEKIENKQKN